MSRGIVDLENEIFLNPLRRVGSTLLACVVGLVCALLSAAAMTYSMIFSL